MRVKAFMDELLRFFQRQVEVCLIPKSKRNPRVLRKPHCSQMPPFNEFVEVYSPLILADDESVVPEWELISLYIAYAASLWRMCYTGEQYCFLNSGIPLTHNLRLHHINSIHVGDR